MNCIVYMYIEINCMFFFVFLLFGSSGYTHCCHPFRYVVKNSPASLFFFHSLPRPSLNRILSRSTTTPIVSHYFITWERLTGLKLVIWQQNNNPQSILLCHTHVNGVTKNSLSARRAHINKLALNLCLLKI